jgi:hypothetical protein
MSGTNPNQQLEGAYRRLPDHPRDTSDRRRQSNHEETPTVVPVTVITAAGNRPLGRFAQPGGWFPSRKSRTTAAKSGDTARL